MGTVEHPSTTAQVPAEPMKILVVDDEPMVRDVLARYLEADGFEVATASDGLEALDAVRHTDPDLVVLDLMLPHLDGLEVMRRLRERADTPVVLLTAKGEEVDRIVGLELGADDYVAKPFSPREVVARVRAVLRRGERLRDDEDRGPDVLEFDDLTIDRARREARRGDTTMHLTRKEFELLDFLASQPGRTFSRTELLEEVWDFAWDGDSSTVTVHIRRLREKIEEDPSDPRRLVTVWGVGYRFEP
jgi:DNA-binding response OmpR family regulator